MRKTPSRTYGIASSSSSSVEKAIRSPSSSGKGEAQDEGSGRVSRGVTGYPEPGDLPPPARSAPPAPLTLVVHAESGRRPGPEQPLEKLGDAVVDGPVAGGRRQREAADLAGRLLLAQQVGFHHERRHGCGAAGIAAGSTDTHTHQHRAERAAAATAAPAAALL